MAKLYTLLDARNFVARYVDRSKDNSLVIDRINEAQRRLISKGNWKFTVRKMRIVTQNNSITCPYEVEKILMVNIDGIPSRVWPQTYRFVDAGPSDYADCLDVWTKDLELEGEGYPTFFDPANVDGDGEEKHYKLCAFSTEADDITSQLTIQGFDELNRDIRTGLNPGERLTIMRWQNGEDGQVDMQSGLTLTAAKFRQITSVYKPVTKGYVSLYAYDPDTNKMWFLSKYHPTETRPGYTRYRLNRPSMPQVANDPSFTDCSCLLCLVKLGYVPAVYDDDLLVIQSLDAIKLMVMAIQFENAKQFDEGQKAEIAATRVLDEQLTDKQTDGKIINVDMGDFGIGDIPNIV